MFTLWIALAWADAPSAAWTTGPVSLHRWADGAIVVAEVDPGTRVEVLLTDGDQTRVRRGLDFGWLPKSSLTSEAPAPSAATAAPPAAPTPPVEK